MPAFLTDPYRHARNLNHAVQRLLSSFSPHHTSWTTPADDYANYHGKVFQVVGVPDGDGVAIAHKDGNRRTTSVRFLGIDAPEIRPDGPSSDHYAVAARARLSRLVLDHTVRLVMVPALTRCKYRRLLAYLHDPDDDLDIGLSLLAHGFAYAHRSWPHPRFLDYVTAERLARDQTRGLWQHATFDQLPRWYQTHERRTRGPLYRAWAVQANHPTPPTQGADPCPKIPPTST